jgi:hypothetical protein
LFFPCFFLFFILSAEAWPDQHGKVAKLISPKKIKSGDTVRILVASEKPIERTTLIRKGEAGPLAIRLIRRGGGPPFWWTGTFTAGREGIHTLWFEHENSRLAENIVYVGEKTQEGGESAAIWQAEYSWTRPFENLYAAWIERLFLDREVGQTWDFLHHVLHDSERNILFNHLGWDEDQVLVLDPDCADNPFFFRAYFARKLGLPYGHHVCDRGTAESASRCDS